MRGSGTPRSLLLMTREGAHHNHAANLLVQPRTEACSCSKTGQPDIPYILDRVRTTYLTVPIGRRIVCVNRKRSYANGQMI